jgi:hypothetical protein
LSWVTVELPVAVTAESPLILFVIEWRDCLPGDLSWPPTSPPPEPSVA